jgi:hypothetical protein
MAQPNVVPSLFGLTPELYQQNRAQDLQAQQIKAATMAAGPGTMLNPSLAPLYAQAAQRGQFQGEAIRGIAGLLGVEDPELAKIRDVQQMRSQFDVSTPTGLRSFAQALGQKGYTDLAIQATARAADIDKDIAAAVKSRREAVPTPQNQAEAAKLESLQAQYPDTLEGRAQAANDFAEWKSSFKQKEAKAGVTGLPMTSNKAFEAADPEALKEYRKESRAAAGQLALISQARQNLPTAVVGQGLPAIVRGLNTQLAPLGINTDQVASTRNLEQALKSIIAQGIKQYGANPSTVDLQFAEKAAADIQDPQQAIAATLQYLENKAKTAVNKGDAAEQYLLKNNNLAGFEKQWTTSTTPKGTKRTKTLSSGLVVEIED